MPVTSRRKGFYSDVRELRTQVADIHQARGRGVGASWYVDTFHGNDDNNDGSSWDSAFATMAAALTGAATLDTIYFRGDVREEIVGSNLKFDITIIGCGSLHHPDQPTAAYDPASATWRPPTSPTAATALLEVRGRGWTFVNIFFDCPVDAAAVKLKRNALSGASEFDASHANFVGCRFVDGKYGIEDSGGCYHITVEDCQFKAMTTAAIANTSTAVANPLGWQIVGNKFPSNVGGFGNASHIIAALNCAIIRDNIFGTVTSTAKYVDLTGGNGNVLTENILGGLYDTSDYVSGTGDLWYQNSSVVKAVTSPDGRTLAVPGA